MKITLYLNNKIMNFRLPSEISGSFSFDEKEEEEIKLINIEAKDNKWYLYSTSDVVIKTGDDLLSGTQVLKNVPLTENTFYTLDRNGQVYLIYASSGYEKNIIAYNYNTNVNIVFGNNDKCNIKYNCQFLNNELFNIKYENQRLILTQLNQGKIYINNCALDTSQYNIIFGDQIYVYGVTMTILNGMILINNPNNLLFINEAPANINFCTLKTDQNYIKDEIKDVELYQENEYFSKSPRLRRFIETKEIKLDPPPRNGTDEEMPMLLVLGPMLTMGITSMVTLISTIERLNSGETQMADSWPQLVSGVAMLLSTLLWPLITNKYQKKLKKRKQKELIKKYTAYLSKKEKELQDEMKLQHDILIENLIPLNECINMINTRGILFWNKRNDENDFLNIRIGVGNAKLDVDVQYPEEGFTIEEDDLKKQADEIVEKYKYINGVPIGYSLYENKVTAVMGEQRKSVAFVNNIILQLLTFYSYEDIKLVVFTSEEKKRHWNYIKYLNHNFTNDKSFRFFASEKESIKNVGNYLSAEIGNRIGQAKENEDQKFKPYYIVIIDEYDEVKKFDFVNNVAETEENLGCSLLILENKLSKLPSKCNNFISLIGNACGVLKNSYEKQEQISFMDEVAYDVNMMSVAQVLSNIPIEFEEGIKQLPDAINFLEMEKVGKVEQLNILNRWNTNDSTISLKSEVGVDEQGNLMYLDLHEKHHGPHGLIAGTTGSGKSEFIITYILSACINYSPDDVAFILIDYKGGGLALAFENKTTGVILPHLAGTITNLDKAEMDRTLVSIDSEVKRRQQMFNEARDVLGESTIDIYKYQRHYHEGRLQTPIPHLFIICDEFAELKSQQPDFMDNLISVARIGRSLGVHLILATQKPSGVVNDQIWSNTKFRVCLKVQDESDSNEMLKRPEAAYLKQAGRFYLQVGMDEYFALGQSGWCGAKYYPSNKIVKQVDKSLNFIDDCGMFTKSIQAGGGVKIEAQGEQLAAIMNNIIEVSNVTNKKAKRLWLENIPPIILVDDLRKKYNLEHIPYNVKAILGEYDAPEKQEQGLLEYSFLEDGNTIIYGLDSGEKEMLLNSIIYSTITTYSVDEINYYILDYGSESLRKFNNFPHVGGMAFAGEDDKLKNLIKLIKTELKERKKLFANYGGEYVNYIKNSDTKLPLKVIVFNNFDSIYENNEDMYDYLPELVRDSERYGIVFIFTANASNSISNRIEQNFNNIYAFKMKDSSEYNTVFNSSKKIEPREVTGRGLVNNGELHEFQTSSIVENEDGLNDYLLNLSKEQQSHTKKANKIPTLPEVVSLEVVEQDIDTLTNVPVGISKSELETVKFDFTLNFGTIISANKLNNTNNFIENLMQILVKISETDILFFDGPNKIQSINNIIKNYYNNDFDTILDSLERYFEEITEKNIKRNQLVIVYGLDKFLSKLNDSFRFETFINNLKKNELIRMIIIEDTNKIKNYAYETWLSNNFSSSEGIWIGKGIADQSIFKLGMISKEDMEDIKNNFGFAVLDGTLNLIKLIEFNKKSDGEDNEK